jgi:hypothetical protein
MASDAIPDLRIVSTSSMMVALTNTISANDENKCVQRTKAHFSLHPLQEGKTFSLGDSALE